MRPPENNFINKGRRITIMVIVTLKNWKNQIKIEINYWQLVAFRLEKNFLYNGYYVGRRNNLFIVVQKMYLILITWSEIYICGQEVYIYYTPSVLLLWLTRKSIKKGKFSEKEISRKPFEYDNGLEQQTLDGSAIAKGKSRCPLLADSAGEWPLTLSQVILESDRSVMSGCRAHSSSNMDDQEGVLADQLEERSWWWVEGR